MSPQPPVATAPGTPGPSRQTDAGLTDVNDETPASIEEFAP